MSTDKAATDKKVPDGNDKATAASKPEDHKNLNDKLQADGNSDKKATEDKKAEDDKKTADAKPTEPEKKDDGSKKPEEHKDPEHKAEGEHKDGEQPKDLKDQLAEEYQDIMAALKRGEQSLMRKVSAWTGYGDAHTASVPKEFPQNLHVPRDHDAHGHNDQRREFTPEAKVNPDGKPRTADGKKTDADGKVVSEASATAVGGDGITKPGDPPKPGDPLAKPGDKAAATPAAEHSYWDDFTSWTSDTFSSVTKPFVEAANWCEENLYDPLASWMGEKWDNWLESGAEKTDQRAAKTKDEAKAEVNLDGAKATGAKIEIPSTAVKDGAVEEFLGNKGVEVYRDGKDTYMKLANGEVVKQNEDGSYNMKLGDGSDVNVKVKKNDQTGKYELERLERKQGDRTLQKVVGGIVYNYNYGADGKPVITAAGDIKVDHALTPKEMHERMEQIRAEFPPGSVGSANLRFINGDNVVRTNIQQLADGSHIETNFDDKGGSVRVFHKNREYVLDGSGDDAKFKIIGDDGKPRNPTVAELKDLKDVEQMRRDMIQALRRAQGDETASVGGLRFRRPHGHHGAIEAVQEDPNKPGTVLSTTEIPPVDQPTAPIKIHDQQTNEVTEVQGNNVKVNDADGKEIMGFNEDTGFKKGDVQVTDQGLTDLISGTLITKDGDIVAADGHIISEGSIGSHSSSASSERMTFAQELAEGQKGSAMVNAMIGPALALVWSGNAGANIASALGVIYEAIGIGSHYLGSLGNNFLARAPVESAIGQAQSAGTKALWQYTTISVASKEGIPASSFAAAYATQRIIGTNASVADIVQEAKQRYGPNELT